MEEGRIVCLFPMQEQQTSTDEELMRLVRKRDWHALENLVDRYRERLYAFCYRNLGLLNVPSSEVDDVFQETWMRVVRSASRFDAQKKFSTWLFTIAVNLCRDARRRLRVEVGQDSDAAGWERSEESSKVLEHMTGEDRRRAVESLLVALPDDHREVLTLRYFEDMDLQEIASATGVPTGTVKSRLHYAMKSVRQMAAERKLDEIA